MSYQKEVNLQFDAPASRPRIPVACFALAVVVIALPFYSSAWLGFASRKRSGSLD